MRRGWEAVLESLHPALEPITPRSRFGALGRLARQLVFRAARPVIFAEHQVHMELAAAIASVGTQVGRVEWSSLFPDELDPGEVVDVQTDVGQLYLHRDDKVMTPFISERGVWEPEEAAFLSRLIAAGAHVSRRRSQCRLHERARGSERRDRWSCHRDRA